MGDALTAYQSNPKRRAFASLVQRLRLTIRAWLWLPLRSLSFCD